MATLLYLHGFLSSPASEKAIQTRNWVSQNIKDMEYLCPFLPPYFDQSRKLLEELVIERLSETVYVMGSSLGGYWATYLAEKYDLRAVLINPLVNPHVLNKDAYVGVKLKNYHTDDSYFLTEDHINELLAVDTPVIRRHQNYYLMVQTGDESLDHRHALEKYHGCSQLVEEGGDHSFQGFEKKLPVAMDFLLRGT